MVDTAQDAVKTVQEASPDTRKRSWYVSEESQEVKRVSLSASTSRSSELRLNFAFSFAITHAVRIA
jgi:hypothetical protein